MEGAEILYIVVTIVYRLSLDLPLASVPGDCPSAEPIEFQKHVSALHGLLDHEHHCLMPAQLTSAFSTMCFQCLQRSVIVPPELAYGKQGLQEIPPNATIELQVQVLSVKS